MATDTQFRASNEFQSCVFTTDNGTLCSFAGVVIGREKTADRAVVATCPAAVEALAKGATLSFSCRRLGKFEVLVNDIERQLSLLAVEELEATPASFAARCPEPGDRARFVVWSEDLDFPEARRCSVRHPSFAATQFEYLVVDGLAPIGSPVFSEESGQLLGVVCQTSAARDQLSFAIPWYVIAEALDSLGERKQTAPAPVALKEYTLGANLVTLNARTREFVEVTNPTIANFAGAIVTGVVQGHPGHIAKLRQVTITESTQQLNYDILWGVRSSPEKPWSFVRQNRSFVQIVRSFCDRRDGALPSNLQVQILVSRVREGKHDNVYTVQAVNLVLRSRVFTPNVTIEEVLTAKLESRKKGVDFAGAFAINDSREVEGSELEFCERLDENAAIEIEEDVQIARAAESFSARAVQNPPTQTVENLSAQEAENPPTQMVENLSAQEAENPLTQMTDAAAGVQQSASEQPVSTVPIITRFKLKKRDERVDAQTARQSKSLQSILQEKALSKKPEDIMFVREMLGLSAKPQLNLKSKEIFSIPEESEFCFDSPTDVVFY